MTEDELNHIETSLVVSLPAGYRRLMTSKADESTQLFWHGWLFNQPQIVIERTVWLRELNASYNISWPTSRVVISEIDGGDLVVLDIGTSGAPVLRWNHETLQLEPLFASVEQLRDTVD